MAFQARGNEANPLVPSSPGITWDYWFIVGKDREIRMLGRHDAFPAHEVWVQYPEEPAQLVHSFNPRDSWLSPVYPNVLSLWAGDPYFWASPINTGDVRVKPKRR